MRSRAPTVRFHAARHDAIRHVADFTIVLRLHVRGEAIPPSSCSSIAVNRIIRPPYGRVRRSPAVEREEAVGDTAAQKRTICTPISATMPFAEAPDDSTSQTTNIRHDGPFYRCRRYATRLRLSRRCSENRYAPLSPRSSTLRHYADVLIRFTIRASLRTPSLFRREAAILAPTPPSSFQRHR
ncbi:hypothetical protein NPIL_84171 [Nephila pilipes]|uniref:Uncharacterized protein n=1 Tax=Nephila pilipes TaxID=299642 RepID=A0A8X6N0P2_NEPPI|nr:hypothetical protein NPIL_84171 [Nephila pilipes]